MKEVQEGFLKSIGYKVILKRTRDLGGRKGLISGYLGEKRVLNVT